MATAPTEPASPVTIAFRPMTPVDLPLMAAWLAEPHVARWWGDADEALAEVADAMAEPTTQPFIILMDGEAVGYIQSYDIHAEADHPYRDQPAGSVGIDLSLGKPDLIGKGHGPRIIDAFVLTLFAMGTPRVVIDPHPDNAAAIRAYAKAGFNPIGERTTIYGPAYMMARDRDNHTSPT